MGFKKNLRKFLNHRFGLDIVQYAPGPSDVSWWITRCDVDLVLDVGANTGQFAQSLFKMGYRGRVVSFEPLSKEHKALTRASASNPHWEVAERCALGDGEGEIEIHLSQDSISSSVLPVTQTLSDNSSGARYVGAEKTPLRRLSAAAASYLKNSKSTFLKIDVQGFEEQVLAGAEEILPQVKGLEIELSFVPLYEGQLLFEDMMKIIRRKGFYLHTLQPFFRSKTGQDLQAEALFFRNGYAPNK